MVNGMLSTTALASILGQLICCEEKLGMQLFAKGALG